MKRKGFTLIELLAVIIVLAIIALIATPIIFNVIENAKIKSLENSCYGVIDAVRTKYAEGLLNSKNGLVDLTGDVADLTIAGEHPYMGTWTIDNSKDSDERGIKIEGVKFASMKNYTCYNDLETGKVSCEKDGPDEVQPTITAKQATVEVNKGTDKKIKDYFTVKFGKTGGQVTCEVANVNELDAGDHTVKCTATGTNGKTAEASVKITVSNSITIFGDKKVSLVTSGDGLYSKTTSTGTTYYFKGAVENNYVKFADKVWRIVRINEDGTMRLITQDNVISSQRFNSANNTYDKMYYTNSEIKTAVENWYKTNITDKGFDGKVVNGNYFCEQAKVVYDTSYTAGNATVATKDNYTPSFDCTTDGNGKGVVSGKVGLITIDEVLFAGGVIGSNSNFYLKNGNYFWMMSLVGINYISAYVWSVYSDGVTGGYSVSGPSGVRPVLNLSADTLASGSGTSSDPYVVK